jgi:hypothetical protein
MTVSIGPYSAGMPFVTIQDVRISQDPKFPDLLTVDLGLSNEKIIQIGTTFGSVTFGNYVHFSTDKSEIEALSSNVATLKKIISSNPKNKFYFSTQRSDFKEKSDSENGTNVYSFFHAKRFNLQMSDNLYVLVCSYRSRNGKISINNIAKETLLEGGVSPIYASIYTLNDTVADYGSANTVWPGSVHFHNNTYMAGAAHSNISHPTLNVAQILNVKLKDLRVVNAARSLDYSFQKTQEVYFSPITLSRGTAGNINGMFTFDLMNYAKNATMLGSFIKNDQSLAAATSIKDIVIYHKLVGTEALGNSLTPGKVKSCGLQAISRFVQVAKLGDDCSVISNTTSNGGMYEIAFIDREVAGVNKGQALYKAEIIVEDKTNKLISDSISLLKLKLKRVKDFIRTGNDQNNFSAFDSLVTDYLTSVQAIFGTTPFEEFSVAFWRKNLLALVNKYNPNYDSDRLLLVQIVQEYLAKIEAVLKRFVQNKATVSEDTKIYRSSRNPINNIFKEFEDPYQFVGTANYGFDYIDQSISSTNSVIPTISFANYKSRVAKEAKKYNIVNTQAATLNVYGFLSPESFNLTPNPMFVAATSLDIPNNEVLPVLQSSVRDNAVLDTPRRATTTARTRQVLQASGISVQRNPLRLSEIVRGNSTARKIIDSEEYLSSTSKFVYENDKLASLSGSLQTVIANSSSVNVFTSTFTSTFINDSIVGPGGGDITSNFSLLEGSPASASYSQNSEAINKLSSASKMINYNSVAQVQYLASYSMSNGVKKQNWALLNEQAYNLSINQSKPLVCKIVSVSNVISGESPIKSAPLTSMFVLGTANTTLAAANPELAVSSINTQVSEALVLDDVNNINVLYSKNVPVATDTEEVALGTTTVENISAPSIITTGITPTTTGY